MLLTVAGVAGCGDEGVATATSASHSSGVDEIPALPAICIIAAMDDGAVRIHMDLNVVAIVDSKARNDMIVASKACPSAPGKHIRRIRCVDTIDANPRCPPTCALKVCIGPTTLLPTIRSRTHNCHCDASCLASTLDMSIQDPQCTASSIVASAKQNEYPCF